MSENEAIRLLLLINLVIFNAHNGTPLECYVCTSVENSACISSLSEIKTTICSSDEIAETTLVSIVSTTASDSLTTSTPSTASTSSKPDSATSTKDPSSEYTSTLDSLITSTTTIDFYTSTITDATSTENISYETTSSTETITSNDEEDSSPTSINGLTSSETSIETTTELFVTTKETTAEVTMSDDVDVTASELANAAPVVRMVRDADVEFACYTLTLIINNETVTDRGCVVKSSSMCDSLNEEKYPEYNLTTCATCTKDGCNSSPINLSGIPSLFLPLIMFILMR